MGENPTGACQHGARGASEFGRAANRYLSHGLTGAHKYSDGVLQGATGIVRARTSEKSAGACLRDLLASVLGEVRQRWMLFSSASVLWFKRRGTPRLVTCPSARWSDTANFLARLQLQPQDVFSNTTRGSTQSHHPAGNFAPHPCAQWALLDPHGRRTKLEAIGRMCYIIACTAGHGNGSVSESLRCCLHPARAESMHEQTQCTSAAPSSVRPPERRRRYSTSSVSSSLRDQPPDS